MDSMDVSTIATRAAKLTGKKLRQITNERVSGYFGGAFAGLVTLFIILHWSRYFASKYSSKNGAITKFLTSLTRMARSVLIRKIPGFTSVGHFLVFVVYIAINLALAFYPVGLDWSALTNWAKRLGWIAVLNIALITFLALKNTPLAFMTAYSYERLNILHQVAGYCTVIFALVHGVVYIQAWHQTNKLSELKETSNVMGIVAGFAMLIILVTALLRMLQYETFYITHIVMYMLILIGVGMHRPDFATKSVIIILFAAIIWALDRIVRSSKIIFNAFGNKATVFPLHHGGTRVVLSRTPLRAVAGDHGFLWIPKIRYFETHPFTIVSTNPLEFVVSAYDGFTRDLHAYAEANPGAALSASIDGPYGTIPSFTSYEHVVLIAGGSGASFTAGVAVRIVNQIISEKSASVVNFIWVVRDVAHLTWYARDLEILAACPNVRLTLHVTRSTTSTTTTSSSSSFTHGIPEETQQPITSVLPTIAADPEKVIDSTAVETHFSSDLPAGLTLRPGRPDVPALIKSAVEALPQNERMIVSACGPDELMAVTRRVVASEIGSCGKSVELHCEQFGW